MSIHKKSGIFTSPQSQAKDVFEKKLAKVVQETKDLPMAKLTEFGANVVEKIIMGVNKALKERSQGFLYDNSRWGFLNKLLDDGRFSSAVISGLLRPEFLALAKTEEVERRALLLKSLSDQEAKDQLNRMSAPDPIVQLPSRYLLPSSPPPLRVNITGWKS